MVKDETRWMEEVEEMFNPWEECIEEILFEEMFVRKGLMFV